jgi:hypothetical protein
MKRFGNTVHLRRGLAVVILSLLLAAGILPPAGAKAAGKTVDRYQWPAGHQLNYRGESDTWELTVSDAACSLENVIAKLPQTIRAAVDGETEEPELTLSWSSSGYSTRPGIYTFTAALPQGWQLADGLEPPAVRVLAVPAASDGSLTVLFRTVYAQSDPPTENDYIDRSSRLVDLNYDLYRDGTLLQEDFLVVSNDQLRQQAVCLTAQIPGYDPNASYTLQLNDDAETVPASGFLSPDGSAAITDGTAELALRAQYLLITKVYWAAQHNSGPADYPNLPETVRLTLKDADGAVLTKADGSPAVCQCSASSQWFTDPQTVPLDAAVLERFAALEDTDGSGQPVSDRGWIPYYSFERQTDHAGKHSYRLSLDYFAETLDFTGTINWMQTDDAVRPAQVTVTLTQDGQPRSQTVPVDSDTTTVTFADLPAGHQYTMAVEAVDGYEIYSGSVYPASSRGDLEQSFHAFCTDPAAQSKITLRIDGARHYPAGMDPTTVAVTVADSADPTVSETKNLNSRGIADFQVPTVYRFRHPQVTVSCPDGYYAYVDPDLRTASHSYWQSIYFSTSAQKTIFMDKSWTPGPMKMAPGFVLPYGHYSPSIPSELEVLLYPEGHPEAGQTFYLTSYDGNPLQGMSASWPQADFSTHYQLEEKTAVAGRRCTSQEIYTRYNPQDGGQLRQFYSVYNGFAVDLTVTKTVTLDGQPLPADSPLADRTYRITVRTNQVFLNGTYGDMTFVNGVAFLDLKAGESASAVDVPYSGYFPFLYVVSEEDSTEYDTVITHTLGVRTGYREERIDEGTVSPGELPIYGQNTVVLTNDYQRLSFDKQWINHDADQPGTADYRSWIHLYTASGETLTEVTARFQDQLTVSVDPQDAARYHAHYDGLPRTDAQGNVITYVVREAAPEQYSAAYFDADGKAVGGSDPQLRGSNGFIGTITNTMKTVTLTAQKQWAGVDDPARPAPAQWQSRLRLYLVDGAAQTDVTARYAGHLSVAADPQDPDRYQIRYTDLPQYDSAGHLQTYALKEADDVRYEAVYYDADGGVIAKTDPYLSAASGEMGTIVNTLKTTDLEVVKRWEDGGDPQRPQPSEVAGWLILSDGSAAIAVTPAYEVKDDGVHYYFRDLPAYDADGEAIVYTVREQLPSGQGGRYTVSYRGADHTAVSQLSGRQGLLGTIINEGQPPVDTGDRNQLAAYGALLTAALAAILLLRKRR